MITGKDLMERGWPQGRAVGLALGAAEELASAGLDDEAILRQLERIRQNPDAGGPPGPALAPLAEELRKEGAAAAAAGAVADELRSEPLSYAAWGAGLIEDVAIEQMEAAMSLPVSVAGALMPDAHLGYGLPVGGVLATESAVIPWAVGVDIACRMRLTVFDAPADELLTDRREMLKDVLLRNTNFGTGSSYKEGRRPEHEVLDDPAWEATPFLKGLKDTARAQLGTSGSGNHFVEWGIFEDPASDAGRLAVLSHSGSRGVGFKIADRYSKIAKRRHPELDKRVADLSWLDLSSEEGEEYWLSMELAGRFASANHAVIHEKIARALGEDPVSVVENHHNFAWREEFEGREVIVHRKGATPARPGVLGVIPGTMGDAGYVVRGKGEPSSINSASHGAGRTMSRRQAFETIGEDAWRRYLKERDIMLIGGSVDEAPMAYKRVDEVIGFQRDLVDILGRFVPRIVRMDGANPRPSRRKRSRKGA